MSTNKNLAVLAASSVLALFSLSPAYAESVPQQEQNELNDSSQPDVDPGASKGPDAPIVKQEGEQLNNSASPDNLPDASGPNAPSKESSPAAGEPGPAVTALLAVDRPTGWVRPAGRGSCTLISWAWRPLRAASVLFCAGMSAGKPWSCWGFASLDRISRQPPGLRPNSA